MTWQVGSWMFDEPSRPSWHNASFVAIDIGQMVSPEVFERRIQSLIAEIHAAPTAAGVERILLPGEREWKLFHQAHTQGIELPADVLEKLRLAAEISGVAFPVSQ